MSNDLKKYIENLMNNYQDETSYGEPQWWVELDSGRCFEITHEEYGLASEEQFFSVRYHCNEEEFDNKYYKTMGVVEQDCPSDVQGVARFVKNVCDTHNEKITDLIKEKPSKTVERD